MKAKIYKARRKHLIDAMGEGGVALIPAAPERVRSRDTHHPYRVDSYMRYLCGFPESDAWLLLTRKKGKAHSVLFCREKDPAKELWDGFLHGPKAAAAAFGLEEAHALAEMPRVAADLLADQAVVYYPLFVEDAWDEHVKGLLRELRARRLVQAPPALHDVRELVDEMRLVKDEAEIGLMQRAVDIAASAHRDMMRMARPGVREYEIEAELLRRFRHEGSAGPSYTPIVASGSHACTLHYVANDGVLRDGDLLLVDAGCEVDGYASDITRTVPVNGRFNPVQRDLYQLVLDAQDAAIAKVRPKVRWDEPQKAVVKVLAQGFHDLGLLKEGVEEIIDKELYKRFYPHNSGHFLGLDVHDAGRVRQGGKPRPLVEGMVLTVEPGCYIPADAEVDERFRGIGIRIEDDVLVTGRGCRVLSAALPKAIADIEDAMSREGNP